MPYNKDARTGSYNPYSKSAREFDKALRRAKAEQPFMNPLPDAQNARLRDQSVRVDRMQAGIGKGNPPDHQNARLKDEQRRIQSMQQRRQG
jgi:hypothetical protein